MQDRDGNTIINYSSSLIHAYTKNLILGKHLGFQESISTKELNAKLTHQIGVYIVCVCAMCARALVSTFKKNGKRMKAHKKIEAARVNEEKNIVRKKEGRQNERDQQEKPK